MKEHEWKSVGITDHQFYSSKIPNREVRMLSRHAWVKLVIRVMRVICPQMVC